MVERVAGVDHLPSGAQPPQTVLGIRVPYRRVATSLEPVRDAATIPAVLEVFDEILLRARHADVVN